PGVAPGRAGAGDGGDVQHVGAASGAGLGAPGAGRGGPGRAVGGAGARSGAGRGLQLILVDALGVGALVAVRQGRWQEAEAALEEALALCQAMLYLYAEAKVLYVYGQLDAARGEPEQAQKRFIAALTICDQLGEGLYRPHIERTLVEAKW